MFTQRALSQMELTGSQHRVLNILASRRDRTTMESRILVREIANILEVPESNVSRTMKELQDRGIVYKLHVGVYRINNNIAYAGDNVPASIQADPEPEWSRE